MDEVFLPIDVVQMVDMDGQDELAQEVVIIITLYKHNDF
jgi:hypothetical protein